MSLEPSTEPDTQLWMCECGVCVAGDYEGVRGVSVCETCVSVRVVCVCTLHRCDLPVRGGCVYVRVADIVWLCVLSVARSRA